MRMRAPDSACLPVQQVTHRAFFTGALSVKVHQDDFFADFCHVSVCNGEGIVGVVVKGKTAQEIQNTDVSVLCREYRNASSRTLRSVIYRT